MVDLMTTCKQQMGKNYFEKWKHEGDYQHSKMHEIPSTTLFKDT